MKTTNPVFTGMRVAVAVLGAASFLLADSDDSSNKKFNFAVIGDMPYGPTAGGPDPAPRVQVYPSPEYDRTIANINADNQVGFIVHVGDIKAGTTRCDNNVYTENLNFFNKFEAPVIYLPGDNEWTDCHRANNGSYDPIGRLTLLRTTFYASSKSLGKKKMDLVRQAGYPENVRWVEGPVVFVGLHMPGSNNNRNRTTGLFLDLTDAEYTARNAANLTWIADAFTLATNDSKIKGLVILAQANPFERFLESGQGYTVSGYADFISSVRTKTLALGKPVVYVGGDTHYFRVDRPLTGTYPACTTAALPCVPLAVPASPTDRVDNFTRVEVFAQNDVHWIKIGVDSKDPNLFSFSPQTVPGN